MRRKMMGELTTMAEGDQIEATISVDGAQDTLTLEVYRVGEDSVDVTLPGGDARFGKIRCKTVTGGQEHAHVLLTDSEDQHDADVVSVEVA